MAVAPDDYLTQMALVFRQCDNGFVDQEIGILPLSVGNMDATSIIFNAAFVEA
jgi:hypothetical protein